VTRSGLSGGGIRGWWPCQEERTWGRDADVASLSPDALHRTVTSLPAQQ
jgi:hypothetical protein